MILPRCMDGSRMQIILPLPTTNALALIIWAEFRQMTSPRMRIRHIPPGDRYCGMPAVQYQPIGGSLYFRAKSSSSLPPLQLIVYSTVSRSVSKAYVTWFQVVYLIIAVHRA